MPTDQVVIRAISATHFFRTNHFEFVVTLSAGPFLASCILPSQKTKYYSVM
jgi:hypothetical protein